MKLIPFTGLALTFEFKIFIFYFVVGCSTFTIDLFYWTNIKVYTYLKGVFLSFKCLHRNCLSWRELTLFNLILLMQLSRITFFSFKVFKTFETFSVRASDSVIVHSYFNYSYFLSPFSLKYLKYRNVEIFEPVTVSLFTVNFYHF